MAAVTKKKSCSQVMEEFKEFMWNPRTREFMGRTGSSWALILTFYITFYAVLTAIFVLSMWVMLQTVNDYTPKYADRLGNPGMMIRPKMSTLDFTLTSQSSSWQQYVDGLNSVLQDYNRTVQEQRGTNCTSGKPFKQEDIPVGNNTKKACQFIRDTLGECSGIGNDTTYGYSKGTPCVLIKINKVVNFIPTVISQLSNTAITVNCTAKNEENDRLLGKRVYFPSAPGNNLGSIDLMYFPYYGNRAQQNYTQPFVAVQFLNATRNMTHTVECRVNAENIQNNDDKDKFQGRVIFTLTIKS